MPLCRPITVYSKEWPLPQGPHLEMGFRAPHLNFKLLLKQQQKNKTVYFSQKSPQISFEYPVKKKHTYIYVRIALIPDPANIWTNSTFCIFSSLAQVWKLCKLLPGQVLHCMHWSEFSFKGFKENGIQVILMGYCPEIFSPPWIIIKQYCNYIMRISLPYLFLSCPPLSGQCGSWFKDSCV